MSGYTEIALLQYELEKLRAELAKKDAKIERLKTVPMMYRRMAFNAQLQDENNELRQRVTEKDEVIAEAGEMLAMRDRQLAELKERHCEEIAKYRDAPIAAYGVLEDQGSSVISWDAIAGWPEAAHEHINDAIQIWKDSGDFVPKYSVVPLIVKPGEEK